LTDLVRLSFSIDSALAERFEDMVRRGEYANRSEFFRDMVRERLVDEQWQVVEAAEAVGTITLVYDHHARGVNERLIELQHSHHDAILATTHVHLDHHLCAEVIICRGQPEVVRSICDRLRQQKGVLHGALSMSSTGHVLVGEESFA
jgi:CopG family nickel-responsive transcriptional regulator